MICISTDKLRVLCLSPNEYTVVRWIAFTQKEGWVSEGTNKIGARFNINGADVKRILAKAHGLGLITYRDNTTRFKRATEDFLEIDSLPIEALKQHSPLRATEAQTAKPKLPTSLAIDKFNEYYPKYCEVRGIPFEEGDVVEFPAKEIGNLKSLLQRINKKEGGSPRYQTQEAWIDEGLGSLLQAFILITQKYQGKSAGWFTSTFAPSQMVGHLQEIRQEFRLIIKAGTTNGQSKFSSSYRERIKATLSS